MHKMTFRSKYIKVCEVSFVIETTVRVNQKLTLFSGQTAPNRAPSKINVLILCPLVRAQRNPMQNNAQEFTVVKNQCGMM